MDKKEAIRGYIQTIYAFVIGFGFLQIKVTDVNLNSSFNWEILFNICLYIFTFTLAAHDWLEYHKRDLPDDMNFIRSIPQMLSLLSVGFMLLHSTYNELLLWSIGGISLTFFNLLVFLCAKPEKPLWAWLPAVLFIFISWGILAIILCKIYRNNVITEFNSRYFLWLGLLSGVVYGLWIIKYKKYGKAKDKTVLENRRAKLQKQLSEQLALNEKIKEANEALTLHIKELGETNGKLSTAKDTLVAIKGELDGAIQAIEAKTASLKEPPKN